MKLENSSIQKFHRQNIAKIKTKIIKSKKKKRNLPILFLFLIK